MAMVRLYFSSVGGMRDLKRHCKDAVAFEIAVAVAVAVC